MTSIEVTGVSPEKITEIEKSVNGVSLYRFEEKGRSFVCVVPARIVTQEFKDANSKGQWRTNWTRKFYYTPTRFDLSGVNIVEDVFVPTRKACCQAVIFTSLFEEDVNGVKRDWLKIESINAYLKPGKGARNERVSDLPDDLKKELFNSATMAIVEFLYEHMTPETRKTIKSIEGVVQSELDF
jgi:hypothetical protein